MAELVIVDDDPDNLQILTEIMTMAGHEVRTGNNGEEGIQLIHEAPPDLAILDVEMPQLTGPDVAYRMFLEDTGLEEIPVVLLSGIVNLREIAARVGTPYFLAKPFHVDALLRMVMRALAERVAPRPQHLKADPPAPLL